MGNSNMIHIGIWLFFAICRFKSDQLLVMSGLSINQNRLVAKMSYWILCLPSGLNCLSRLKSQLYFLRYFGFGTCTCGWRGFRLSNLYSEWYRVEANPCVRNNYFGIDLVWGRESSQQLPFLRVHNLHFAISSHCLTIWRRHRNFFVFFHHTTGYTSMP